MSNERVPRLALCLGLLAALAGAWQRVGLERDHRSVALVADYGEIQALAAFAGQPAEVVLARLKTAGLTGVAIEEPTLTQLRDAGQLTVELGRATDGTLLGVFDDTAGRRLLDRLRLASPVALSVSHTAGAPIRYVQLPVPWRVLADLGAGLDPAAVAAVRRAGLTPIARLRNAPGLSPGAIGAALRQAVDLGAPVVIFSGDKVLGHPGLTREVAREMVALGLLWGRVEFAKQKGETTFAEAWLDEGRGGYLRVHSITEGEMDKTPATLAIERYRRAAAERNIRLCFVRLLLGPANEPLAANADFVSAIAGKLTGAGLTLGEPSRLPAVTVPLARRLVVGCLGVAAVAAWAWTLLLGWCPRRFLAWWLVAALACGVALAVAPGAGGKLVALLAGLVCPSLGARAAWLRLSAGPRSLPAALAVVWLAAGWSVAGGLLIVGLLSETGYLLAHDIFAGVKLTQLVPLLVAGALVATNWSVPGVEVEGAKARWWEFWRSPVQTFHVALALGVLLAVGLLLLRSGNDGVEISPLELHFRAWLENIFGARPRTKEFLLGYPALTLAALAAWRGWRAWVPGLYLVGMVGLVSTLNTFCHLHTPLSQSLLRTFHALWLGNLLGLTAWPLLARLARRADG